MFPLLCYWCIAQINQKRCVEFVKEELFWMSFIEVLAHGLAQIMNPFWELLAYWMHPSDCRALTPQASRNGKLSVQHLLENMARTDLQLKWQWALYLRNWNASRTEKRNTMRLRASARWWKHYGRSITNTTSDALHSIILRLKIETIAIIQLLI